MVLKIISFKLKALISVKYDRNARKRPSAC